MRRVLVALAAAALAAAPAATARPTADAPITIADCTAGQVAAVGSETEAFAAVVRRRAVAYRKPGERAFKRFGARNVNGFPMVFGVLGAVPDDTCAPAWLRVQLPMRPNGTTGYVRARDVAVERVQGRILIDVSARRLTFYYAGKKVLSTRAAVGASATPTPLGHYYVNQRFISSDSYGPYGPFALGISAFSPTLIHWAQGGPVGIHGTNAPWSIGHPVSNGCIRVPNAVIRKIFRRAFAGTPVVIRK